MQPTPLLPIADFTAIDITALTTPPASPATRSLAAAFADLLGENTATRGSLSASGGERLPESGNILPVAPHAATDAVIAPPSDPEEIVASLQRELEHLTSDEVSMLDRPAAPQVPDVHLDLDLDLDVEGHVLEEALTAAPTPVPPSPVITAPQSVDALGVGSDSADNNPLAEVLAPAATRVVEPSKPTTQPAAAVVVLPPGQAEIRPVLPRAPGPTRAPSAPAAPTVTASDDGTLDVVRAQPASNKNANLLQELPASRRSVPASPADLVAPVLETSPASRPVGASLVEPELSSGPVAATTSRSVASPAPETVSTLAPTAPAVRSSMVTPLPVADLTSALTTTIDLPVQESGWDKVVSERVLMMANNKLQSAEIRLTPAELGPLRVQMAIEDGAAKVSFAVQHALTRDAIEQALPRLREMLAEAGLTLGEASVGDEVLDYSTAEDADRDAGTQTVSGDDNALDSDTPVDMPPRRVTQGLVDTFV